MSRITLWWNALPRWVRWVYNTIFVVLGFVLAQRYLFHR